VWAASIFASRDFAPRLLEETEDKDCFVHLGGFSGATGLEHGKALAIGVQVKIKRE